VAHASNLVYGTGPESPYAFFNIPLATRNGALDARCPNCQGYGQWNVELDLVSMRSKRAVCDTCLGSGWIETGNDALAVPDIVRGPTGHPMWIIRYLPCR
jgi:hypothetical protein